MRVARGYFGCSLVVGTAAGRGGCSSAVARTASPVSRRCGPVRPFLEPDPTSTGRRPQAATPDTRESGCRKMACRWGGPGRCSQRHLRLGAVNPRVVHQRGAASASALRVAAAAIVGVVELLPLRDRVRVVLVALGDRAGVDARVDCAPRPRLWNPPYWPGKTADEDRAARARIRRMRSGMRPRSTGTATMQEAHEASWTKAEDVERSALRGSILQIGHDLAESHRRRGVARVEIAGHQAPAQPPTPDRTAMYSCPSGPR